MEKKFTLMKTLTALTAFIDLLFLRSKKNSIAVNNDQTSATPGCGTGTTVNDHLIYVNDLAGAGSFLFFNEAAIDGEQLIDQPQSHEEKFKNKEELNKVNDELAQRNVPKPVYNNWRERVNDDLAACNSVVSGESVVGSRESVTAINDLFKNNFPTTSLHNETRTNKNDAFLPFASFSFLVRRSLGVGGFLSTIISVVLKSFKQNDFNKNLKPILIPVRPSNKSRMRF